MELDRRTLLGTAGCTVVAAMLLGFKSNGEAKAGKFPLMLSEAEWRRRLEPTAFQVLREEGTERAFTSPLLDEHRPGIFMCKGCALPLFSSKTKFDSGTGWPSFWQPVAPENVETEEDNSFLMRRTEAMCSKCGAHLGHVFDDGPKPTGLRYCMNGLSLKFIPGAAGGPA